MSSIFFDESVDFSDVSDKVKSSMGELPEHVRDAVEWHANNLIDDALLGKYAECHYSLQ